MGKKPYHVVPDINEDTGTTWWVIQTEGAKSKVSRHRKKSTAVREAKRLGDKNNRSVIFHRKDGTVDYGWDCGTTGSR